MNTRVLVWQEYGITRVFEAGDHHAIIARIEKTVDGWGVDDQVSQLKAAANRKPELFERYARSFAEQHKEHETFEVFEFCEIQKA